MSLSGVPPLLLQLAGHVQHPAPIMASNEEEEDEQMSDSDDMPYIKCEAVYGEDGDDDDDEMSALPFVSTEMREDMDDSDNDKMKFGMRAPEVGAYVKCSVPSCHSYFEVGNPKYEGFSHFKFPEDPNMRRRWIGIIGQKEDWKPEGAMICSNHFNESAFVTHLQHVEETGRLMTKRSLKPGAIPTINLDIPKNTWNTQRILQPPNNGVQVQAAAPVAPAARPVVPPAVLPATPIRSPYCQGELHSSAISTARTITLTKNGKRRGRPPKNRPLDEFSPNVSQLATSGNAAQTVEASPTPAPNATSTPVSASTSSAASQANGSGQITTAGPASQPNNFIQNQLPPFQLLGMGRRKRGRPRKEVRTGYSILQTPFCDVPSSKETLRRLAEGTAEAAFGWRNNWRRNNVPIKRRKILPAPTPGTMRQRRVEQLECTIDPLNFLQLQHQDVGSDSLERDLLRLRSLVSSVGDLSAKSLAELCRVVESTLERLRKAEAIARAKKENEAKSEVKSKEMKAEVDVKLPPSLSIKAVGPKTSNHSSSVIDEEPIPALTITIKREGKLVNGEALKVEDIKKEPLDIKIESVDVKKEPLDDKYEAKTERDSDDDKEDEEEGPAEEEEDAPETEEDEGAPEGEKDNAPEGEDAAKSDDDVSVEKVDHADQKQSSNGDTSHTDEPNENGDASSSSSSEESDSDKS